MRLNLGCGFRKLADHVNVDKAPACEPDRLVDLDVLPWPFADDSAASVVLHHTLEHLAPSADAYLALMRELWRICRADAAVTITVPHPRHDSFLNDPTHVRAITPAGLELFDQAKNREWRAKGYANTPLGLHLGIDFSIDRAEMRPDEPWRSDLAAGRLKHADLLRAARQFNNVILETEIVLIARKPAGHRP